MSISIPDSLIIGSNFFEAQKATLNYADKSLNIDSISVPYIGSHLTQSSKTPLPIKDINSIPAKYSIPYKPKSENYEKKIKSLINTNSKITYDNYGTLPNYTHNITLKENADLCSKRIEPFRFTNKDENSLLEIITDLLDKNIIIPSSSKYCSPAFLTKKKDGTDQMVIDYVKLNSFSNPDHFPLPNTESVIKKLKGAKFFSKLDLKSGYYHVNLTSETSDLTAFVVPQGNFQFLKLPFGLSSGPQAFARALDSFVSKTPNCHTYLDDIMIATSNLKDHFSALNDLFSLFNEYQININWKKCEFLKESISFLGQIISEGSMKADLTEFNKINLTNPSRNIRELRSLIGKLNYFRTYVRNFSELSLPLTDKIKMKNFEWAEKNKEVCNKIFEEISKNQELYIPDNFNSFYLSCDASERSCGGILEQNNKLVRIFSKKFKNNEKNLSIVEKEGLSILNSFRNFKTIIGTTKVFIETDNKNLTFFKADSARSRSFYNELSNFNYEIRHIKGSENNKADSLSRIFSIGTTNKIQNILTKLKIDYMNSNNIFNNKLIIPEEKTDEFLKLFHDEFGHPGQTKTQNSLKNYFSFKSFYPKISSCNSNCLPCAKNKSQRINYGELKGVINSPKPFSKISTNLVGPLDLTDSGLTSNEFLITISDFFSRFTKVVLLDDSTSESIIEAIDKKWLLNFSKHPKS